MAQLSVESLKLSKVKDDLFGYNSSPSSKMNRNSEDYAELPNKIFLDGEPRI
jgi:hypothetical protein